MLNFGPIPVQNISASGEVAFYIRLKELAESMWDCVTCKLPCCLGDEYGNLNEEEEEQQPAPNDLPAKTDRIPIETEVKPSKKPRVNLKDLEEVKSNENEFDKLSHEKKSTHFEDLELTNLTNPNPKCSIESFPKEEFFILKSSYCQMLVKIREVKLSTPTTILEAQKKWLKDDFKTNSMVNDPNFADLTEDSKLQQIYEERYSIFSKYREGIRITKEDWKFAVPELVAECIAKRLGKNCKTILDAFCGAGSHTIQLGLASERVIVFENSKEKIENCVRNAEIYQVNKKIQFIEKDFLDADDTEADVIFINLWKRDTVEEFSLWNDLNPSLRRIIDTALTISDSFAILLPSKSRLDELVEIIYEILEKHEDASKRSFIEIDQIKLDDRDNAIAVFYGKASSVSAAEEMTALQNIFKLDTDKGSEFKQLVEYQGLWRAFKANVQESDKPKNESISNVFS